MKPEDIHLTDWMRVLIGEVPGNYFAELIIRITFAYLVLTVAMRLMGKRMAAQLNLNELAALVSLAAAVGIPIMSPDRGLLPAVVVAAVIVFIQRSVASLARQHQRFEAVTQGSIDMLVVDSVLQLDKMMSARITRERVMAQLRSSGLMHLGQVKRLYIESTGSFTLIENETPQPGLTVLPFWDMAFREEQKQTKDQFVCNNCGTAGQTKTKPTTACPHCHDNNWVPAVDA